MKALEKGMKFVGVDGCRGGWLAVWISGSDRPLFRVYESMHSLWQDHADAALVFIDMPIGLPHACYPVREADQLARKELGPRRSSVFSAPARCVLQARNYDHACEISMNEIGRKLSRQTWNIVPKIAEIDEFLAEGPERGRVLREAHPEVCFTKCAKTFMNHNKKTLLGAQERLCVIRRYYADGEAVVRDMEAELPKKTAVNDDMLDAFMLALAAREAGDHPRSLPVDPPRDQSGLPMAIWYCDPDL